MPPRRLLVCLSIVLAAGVLLASAPARAQIRATVVASGLTAPLAFVQDPSDPNTQYIVQQGGRIRVLSNGVLSASDFLDLSASISSGGERGLLGLAFPPDYATSGRFYVNFTNPNGDTVVARFKRSAGSRLVADPASRFDLQWSTGERVIRQPYPNHNGGNLAFGPDGFLYVGMGDGGSANDPGNLAQDPTSLLGKMLRIDVSVPDADARGFRVPPDNPFLSGTPVSALPEIWDFGLRNPWRYSFDDVARGGTGALVIGDVGQSAWEEVDYEPAGRGGRNYGWRWMEGSHPNVQTVPPAFLPLVNPILEYDHSVGVAVVGGFVYRGLALGPAYRGRYFYADLSGRVWSVALTIDPVTGEATAQAPIEHTAALGGAANLAGPASFGVDASGELYIVGLTGGKVLRIDPTSPADFNGDGHPDLLWRNAATGQVALWAMNGTSVAVDLALPGVADPRWQIAATADFNGDGSTDIVWRNSLTGQNVVWFMAGTSFVSQGLLPTVADTSWHIAAAADFNGDGKPDLVWRNWSTGQNVIWFLDGTSTLSQVLLPTVADVRWQIAAAADFNRDGKPDLLWRNASTGLNLVWLMNGSTFSSQVLLPALADPRWVIGTAADVDGDGSTDIVWRNAATGADLVWFMSRTTLARQASLPPVANTQWQMLGARTPPRPAGDFNGDGQADILWRNGTTGQNLLWFMNGAAVASQASPPPVPDVSWKVAITADIDGDGLADIVWRNAATGQNVIWFMNGATILSQTVLPAVADPAWQVVAAGDFDGDGRTDLVWRNAVTGWNAVWFLDAGVFRAQALLPPVLDANWRIVGAADFNGDGWPDLVWRNGSTGLDVVWYLNGTTFLSQALLPSRADTAWEIAQVGDFNADGRPDLVWRNTSTGSDEVWFLSGISVVGQAALPAMAAPDWTVGG